MNKTFFAYLLLLIMAACSSSIENAPNVKTLYIEESMDGKEQESRIISLKDYVIIPLENSDSIVIYGTNIYGEWNDNLIIGSNNSIYFFDKKNGQLEYLFNKYGNGPQEYLFINDFTFNPAIGKMYIHDLPKRTINEYDSCGTFIKSVKNDSVAAIMMNDNGNFITTYSPSERWNYHIGIYDSLFNVIGTFCNKEFEKKDTDFFTINSVCNFGGYNYVLLSDTLYAVSEKGVTPSLVIDKGNLKLPKSIGDKIDRRIERENYIWGDYLYLIGDYCFLSYNYKGHIYYDVWSISNSELMLRNKVSYEKDEIGIPVLFDGKLMNLWPKSVIGSSVYFVLNGELMQNVIPTRKEDDNPIIIVADIDDIILNTNSR